MTRLLLAASTLALLAGCATTPPDFAAEDFLEAAAIIEEDTPRPVEIVTEVEPLALPGQMKLVSAPSRKPKPPAKPAEVVRTGARAARIEPSVDGYVNAVQVYPFVEGALYRLYAAPGQVSDIALQPGETLVSVSAGDTVRWVVGDTHSGSGGSGRAHVLVKPIGADLSTNLMIATDRRTYHLELESTSGGYMAAVSWRYPADELADLKARNAAAQVREDARVDQGLSLSSLNFAYRIEGDDPAWKPVRVFDDGTRVFIQMPEAMAVSDAPPLFVLGASGEAELVNYRVKGRYYIVDRLFAAAELRLGTKDQTIVRILKGEKRWSWFGS
ncbi:MAG: P-type conjugative transfer protein TrbG [Hirschia sp.]|nr:P-type conjugative transfer protein TrbG [Hirschia sp.]MBF16908.1 P-type conjugative transfer protein TrbG [Hirschia sp.]|tara:strand:+ start:643 stop:1629 length:987 start_codon:yes stop_codon:yes gene_type:complete